jgi:hypothetical protein
MYSRVLPLQSTATSTEFLDAVLHCGELPGCLTVHAVEPKQRKEGIHSLREGDEITPEAEHWRATSPSKVGEQSVGGVGYLRIVKFSKKKLILLGYWR